MNLFCRSDLKRVGMRRRDFIKSVLAVGGTTALGAAALGTDALLAQQASSASSSGDLAVKRVRVMFKCHFDAGFIDTQANVVHWYFADYFPQAIRLASDMRQSGGTRYVWTTGSWLLYEYLEQANSEERRRMEQAISAGDIAWHAIPFSWQTELMDPSMISGSIALSQSLDRRFGRTTTGAKMTDVPGHTRGLVSPLSAQGVKFLDIGVNDASTPAEVPPLFLWKDRGGASLVVMYHHGYGGITRVPGSDQAIAIVVRGDNSGPHTPPELVRIYRDLGRRFPNAEVVASSLTEIANTVEPFRAGLPIVTQEIGDTWIYGVSSDPLKLARYREVARRRRAWIDRGAFRIGDATDIALLRKMLLEPEHTWGTDTKTWLDFDNYTPTDLTKMLDTKNYKVVEFSWAEKRKDLLDGVATLPASLRAEAEMAIRDLDAKEPEIKGGEAISATQEIETEHYLLNLDARTGAIHGLRNKKSGQEWASPNHPLALFSYQTLSQQDYARFMSNYIISSASWAKQDFGKPNIDRFGAKSESWQPSIVELRAGKDAKGHRLLARMEIDDPDALRSGRASFPRKMYLELLLPDSEPVVYLNFYWFQKSSTRLPESLWLTFNPQVRDPQDWMLDKSGEPVSPLDVVRAGGRHLHAVSQFSYRENDRAFVVEPLDAPLIAAGERSPLNFSKAQPDLSGGIHSNLFNNAWGTNYIMWYGQDMRFRYVLHA